MAKLNLYFVTTRNCNLKCRHCYLEAGPGNLDTTISPENFKAAVGNLPKESIDLCLSGGEVFTIEDKLFSYLESIQEENIERKYKGQELITSGVQTNGCWATDDKKIKSTLVDFASLGVKYLDIASDDEYHRNQGINIKNIESLKKQAKDSGFFKFVYLRGANNQSIMPLGRAKKMHVGEKYVSLMPVCQNFLYQQLYTIREDGKVYPCCFCLHPLPGNIIEEPFDDIISKTEKDERLNMLNSGGIRQLALHDGCKENKVEKMIMSYGECGSCARLYGQ